MPDLAQLNLVINSGQVATGTNRLENLARAASKAEGSTNRLSGSMSSLAGSMKSLVGIAGALAASYAAVGVIQKSLAEAAWFEKTEVAFETLLKSATSANKMMNEIQSFASSTSFEMRGLAENAQRLLAMGTAAEDVLPMLRVIGNAGTLLGGEQTIQRISLALTQMQQKNKVNHEEMRQLTEAGIGSWQMLADAIGTDVPKAMKLAERGMLDSSNTVLALLAGMEKRYGGGMERWAKTAEGRWSAFQEAITKFYRELGQTFFEAFGLKEGLAELTEYFKATAAIVIDLIRALSGLEPKLQSTRWIVEPLADSISKIWPDIKKGFYALLEVFEKGWAYIKFGFGVVWDAIETGAMAALEALRKIVLSIVDVILSALRPLAQGGGGAKSMILNQLGISPEVVQEVVGGVSAIREAMATPLSTKSFSDFVSEIGKDYGTLEETINGIERATTKKINGANTGFFADMKAAFVQIPGLGQLMEYKNAINRELEAQDAPYSQWKGALKKPGQIVKAADYSRIKEILNDLEMEKSLVGKTAEERERIVAVYKAQELLAKLGLEDDAKALQMLEQYKDSLGDFAEMKKLEQVAGDIGTAFSQSFEDAILGAKSLKEAFIDLGQEIQKILLRALVIKPLEGMISSGLTGLFTSMAGVPVNPTPTPTAPPVASALGNVFSMGRLMAFANGGIVDSPMTFPMRGGRMGLMGEAGPEGILPLSRGTDGRLGVKAHGGGSTVVKNTYVQMSVSTPNADSFRRSSRQIAGDIKRATGR
jgi:tape measure domain-containing protein